MFRASSTHRLCLTGLKATPKFFEMEKDCVQTKDERKRERGREETSRKKNNERYVRIINKRQGSKLFESIGSADSSILPHMLNGEVLSLSLSLTHTHIYILI